MIRPTLFALVLACGASACSPPKRDLSVEQLSHVQKLKELMDAQATIADPQFKKRDQQNFTDAEIATLRRHVETRVSKSSALHDQGLLEGSAVRRARGAVA